MPAQRVFFVLLCLVGTVDAEPLTLPRDQRPEWLQQDGIVMAGSWEPLLFRVRRDGAPGYTPSDEQRAAYRKEHSPEMVDRLKDLGVNFVMMHCYKGAGLQAERESMQDAVRFARLCHARGLRVGVYVYSGAFIWELFFKEVPEAQQWVLHDENGKPLVYASGRAKYRYYWNRCHPDAQAYYRKIVRFAVQQIKTDLVHFDNYSRGPGYETDSVRRFRKYLKESFSPQRLAQMGVADPSRAAIPTSRDQGWLRFVWDDFRSHSLAESYFAMSRYARSLRPDVLIECNPGGIARRISPPTDHGRLLQGGEAFWDEGKAPGYEDGRLSSRIRTYKVARGMDNTAFCYTTTPLEMAESMAFNRDCLGAVCWFEYGSITRRPGSSEPVSSNIKPYIRFFHRRRDLLRGAEVVADVAVLRSFPSQVFADQKHARLTAEVEDALIAGCVPFQIIHDHQLDRLEQFRALVLAGCPALGDRQLEQIKAFGAAGGHVCLIGPTATHNEWMESRDTPALADLPGSRTVRFAADADVLDAVRRVCDNPFSLTVDARPGLCAELTKQEGRRLVHLVNYRINEPARDVAVCVRLSAGQQAESVRLANPSRETDLALTFRRTSDGITFTVPNVDVYEVAVVTTQ